MCSSDLAGSTAHPNEAETRPPDRSSADLSEADLRAIAERFQLPAPVARIRPLGNGNVNRTYLVELEPGAQAAPGEQPFRSASLERELAPAHAPGEEPTATETDGRGALPNQPPQALVLQALNTKVFTQPQLVMANMRRVTEQIGRAHV